MNSFFFLFILVVAIVCIELYSFKALQSRWNYYKNWLKQTVKWSHLTFMFLSIIGFFALFFAGSSLPLWLTNFFFAFVFFNLSVKLVFALFLLLDDARRGIVWVRNKFKKRQDNSAKNEGVSRSDFLVKSGLIAASIPAISLPTGLFIGPYRYTLHQPTVQLPNLPVSFEGFKIVQISDIHAGSFYDKKAVNRGIDLLLAQQPDVIFFTGDLVNNKAIEMDNYMDIFSRLKAPHGVYSVLGNHDYGDYEEWKTEAEKIANLDRLKEIHKELGWQLLLDEHVYLSKNEDKIGVIGVENWGAGFHKIGDLAKAYEGCNAPVKLLLSHDPTHWDEEVRTAYPDIDITFSGHTHGAQMGIETGGFKWSPISLRYDKWAGLYKENKQYLYVNRGYGFIGYPGRIGIWPEITVMTLTKNQIG